MKFKLIRSAPAALLAAAMAACGQPPLPAAPPIIDVSMREYEFDYRKPSSRGRTIFRVVNQGRIDHELVLVRLPDDLKGTLEQQLRGPKRRSVAPIRVLGTFPPQQGTVFAVDLKPGRYGLLCFLKSEDGQSHALKGMNSDFGVG